MCSGGPVVAAPTTNLASALERIKENIMILEPKNSKTCDSVVGTHSLSQKDG